ncbi:MULTISPECIES: ABC transporter ATP-binding protein [unclassified Aminobacter]|uniref:energy-coupling factor ABC transporter ATP-binding protein n=1 Tax=unclassified Aminobacter TaxID=2644704 RepID=UPI000463B029|nr:MULTISPECIES: ABC transporter ATP-binding protein [unclassified Aminobacter]TWH31348.1 energy-coupling factor transport system ATP-binding protein [Aminobacter sp. J15]
MLVVEDVSFAYPGSPPLFEHLSLRAGAGEIIAVVGRNGAGKSTFLRLLNGLLRPDRGAIFAAGTPTAKLKINEIAALVGTLFQTPEQQLFAGTAQEEVRFGPLQFGLDKDVAERRVEAALRRCGLEGSGSVHPLDLGYAERRFVALASVLVNQPRILLLDEPQRGLDRIWLGRLETIIREEREAGRAIILVCHDMDFVLRNASAVLALGAGHPRLMETGAFFRDRDLVAQASVTMPARLQLEALLADRP